jgi:hypothetical protein
MEDVTPSRQASQVENRGGDRVDWGRAVAGEPLPPLGEEYPEPDSTDVPARFAQAGLASAQGLGEEEPPGANDPEAQ